MNSFSIDQDIHEKEKEFERYLETIYQRISKEKIAFKSAMNEYRRRYQERELDHKQKVQSLEIAREELSDIFKSNFRDVQHCRKELMMMTSNRLHKIESKKKIARVKVEYNQSIFTNVTKFFEVKYFTQTDWSKKVKPIHKLSQGEQKMVYGCDTGDNKIYMADYSNSQVYVVNRENGEALEPIGVGHISQPWGVKVHEGAVYVTEPNKGRISVFNKNGGLYYSKSLDRRASNPENANSKPTGIDVDKNGIMYIADIGQKKVHIFDSKTRIMSPEAVGEIRESLVCPQDVKVVGGKVYVLDNDDLLVKVFDRDWNYIKSIIPKSGRTSPVFFTVNSYGYIFMCDERSRCIQVYDSQGNLIHQIPYPPTADYLSGISVNQNGEIFVTNYGDDLYYIF